MARTSKTGKKTKAKARKAGQAKGGKTTKTKGDATGRRTRSAADQETEVTRLKRELKEALEQQEATAEILRVISASPGELGPIFDVILRKAHDLCGAPFGALLPYDGEFFRLAVQRNLPPAWAEWVRGPIRPGPKHPLSRVVKGEGPLQIEDLRELADRDPDAPMPRAGVDLGGIRTLLYVPLRKDDVLFGVITAYRKEVSLFTNQQIALLQTFADQAVIAIENTRLLTELRQRTNDLSKSLNDLRTAQDRLVQTEKLASLGQLTAGIAHEIKNPLNFVNNFAALSAELVDEMTEVLDNPQLDESNRRRALDEIRELLKGNLEKVVQHGKRADSIVKNMLLHSREGSGEHRPIDVNALVEESLNLAYHGARAEKPQFNVAIERELDPQAGTIEAFPQEITRVLLNLISNGFYAVSQRKVENGADGFEPVVKATTSG